MKQKFNFKRKKTNKAKKVLLGIGVGFLALAAAAGTAWALNNHYDWVELPEWLTPETSEPVTSEEPPVTSEEPVVNPTLEYQVKHSLDTSLLVEADFVKTEGTVMGQPVDLYTLIDEEFKLMYSLPLEEPFSLTYTSTNSLYGLKLEVTTTITPIKSLAYLNGASLKFADTGASGIAYFTVGDIGLPQNYVIEIIQFV
ncbi:MAG: hypothetical protein RBQ97_10175 [Acholeplasma sp.]|nr:hypothetical protein [Acholeplasma sp.]